MPADPNCRTCQLSKRRSSAKLSSYRGPITAGERRFYGRQLHIDWQVMGKADLALAEEMSHGVLDSANHKRSVLALVDLDTCYMSAEVVWKRSA